MAVTNSHLLLRRQRIVGDLIAFADCRGKTIEEAKVSHRRALAEVEKQLDERGVPRRGR